MKFKKMYKIYEKIVEQDINLESFFQSDPMLELFVKWYNEFPNFEAEYTNSQGYTDSINIELGSVLYNMTEIPIAQYIKNAFVVGNDNGDNLYVFIYSNPNYKSGIYRIDDTLDLSSLTYISDSLDDLFLEA